MAEQRKEPNSQNCNLWLSFISHIVDSDGYQPSLTIVKTIRITMTSSAPATAEAAAAAGLSESQKMSAAGYLVRTSWSNSK